MEKFLEIEPVAAMRQNIAQYHSKTRMRLEGCQHTAEPGGSEYWLNSLRGIGIH